MATVPLGGGGGMRCRLRFMSQEIDIRAGQWVLGRGEECEITLFDPLISRRHACIRVPAQAPTSTIEDLGSRNGTRVNGVRIVGVHRLCDGDRISLGKSEMVFREMPVFDADARTTGSLVYCARCQLVYSREAGSCPHCASSEVVTEVTRSSMQNEGSMNHWALQILVDVLEKALDAGEIQRAERLMEEGVSRINERLSAGHELELSHVESLARAAIRLSELGKTDRWTSWLQDIYTRAGMSTDPRAGMSADRGAAAQESTLDQTPTAPAIRARPMPGPTGRSR